MDLGDAEPLAILVFGALCRCDLFGRLSGKRDGVLLVCVVPPQKSIFCFAGFGSTIALDQGLQTTACEPNPARDTISSDPREDFVDNEKIMYLRRIS